MMAISIFLPQVGQVILRVMGWFMTRSVTAVTTESILSNRWSNISRRSLIFKISGTISCPLTPGLSFLAKVTPSVAYKQTNYMRLREPCQRFKTIDYIKGMAYTGAQIKQEGDRQMPEEEIGKVSDFFAHPVVAGIELIGRLKVGDKVHIKGRTTDLEFAIDSIEINNVSVTEAKVGDAIGIKVSERVRRGDKVYKVTE